MAGHARQPHARAGRGRLARRAAEAAPHSGAARRGRGGVAGHRRTGAASSPRSGAPAYATLIRLATELPGVDRVLVNPAIKRQLCLRRTGDRAWLRLVRPWYGHTAHMHIHFRCPPGQTECRDQSAVRRRATGATPRSTGGSPSWTSRPRRRRRRARPSCRPPAPRILGREAGRLNRRVAAVLPSPGSAPSSTSTRRNRCCRRWPTRSAPAVAQTGLTVTAIAGRGRLVAPVRGRHLRRVRAPPADRRRRAWRSWSRPRCARLAPSLEVLILCRFLQGLLLPFIFAVTVAYIADECPGAEGVRATAIYSVGTIIGGFSGRFIAGWAAQFFGWRASFLGAGRRSRWRRRCSWSPC